MTDAEVRLLIQDAYARLGRWMLKAYGQRALDYSFLHVTPSDWNGRVSILMSLHDTTFNAQRGMLMTPSWATAYLLDDALVARAEEKRERRFQRLATMDAAAPAADDDVISVPCDLHGPSHGG